MMMAMICWLLSLTGEHCVVFTVIVVVLLLSLLHHFGMWHCFISHGLTLTLTQTTETWGSIGIWQHHVTFVLHCSSVPVVQQKKRARAVDFDPDRWAPVLYKYHVVIDFVVLSFLYYATLLLYFSSDAVPSSFVPSMLDWCCLHVVIVHHVTLFSYLCRDTVQQQRTSVQRVPSTPEPEPEMWATVWCCCNRLSLLSYCITVTLFSYILQWWWHSFLWGFSSWWPWSSSWCYS